MQIIESTDFGVRSAIIYLEAGKGAPRFTLFPMVHVAEAAFYEEIARRLEACDVVLCEGVKSPTASLLTASYRYFANQTRLGLVSQRSMKLDHIKDRLIHADVSGEAFEKQWSKLSVLYRMVLPLAAPAIGLYIRYFGTRKFIARHLSMNLRKSREDILKSGDSEKVDDILLNWRDQRLLEVIERERLKQENVDLSIGILFGAAHMRSVIRYLMDSAGYRVIRAEWVRVFGL